MFSSPRLDNSATLSRTVPAVLGSTEADRGYPTLLCPPELLRPVLNRHLGRCVEPLAGARRPPCSSWPRFQFPFPPSSQARGLTVCDALPPHSRPRPILPAAKRVRLGDAVPPHVPLASPYRDSGSSARMSQNAGPSVPSSLTPIRCTTAGTSVVPSVPLARYLGAWLAPPSPSHWLIRTIRLGYAIQFARRPPKFSAVLETSVAVRNTPVLRDEMALRCSDAVQVALLKLCFYLLFYLLLLSLFTHITSALITYDKGTLLDIGNHFTNLVHTLSPNLSWPLEILRNAEENNGHRRRNKKHCGNSAGIRNRLRKRAHSPSLPSILLANVQSLENKMDDLRARISFQRDIRDCNIICLTETWLTPSVPDTAVTASDNFSVLRMDRTAEAGKSKGGGVCLMTNKK